MPRLKQWCVRIACAHATFDVILAAQVSLVAWQVSPVLVTVTLVVLVVAALVLAAKKKCCRIGA